MTRIATQSAEASVTGSGPAAGSVAMRTTVSKWRPSPAAWASVPPTSTAHSKRPIRASQTQLLLPWAPNGNVGTERGIGASVR
jgi:hypothetical protein